MIVNKGSPHRSVLRDFLFLPPTGSGPGNRGFTLQSLKEEVSAKHGVTVAALESRRQERRRNPQLIAARVEYCQRAYAMEAFSLPEIGRSINRHHTTVLHHVRKARG